MGPNGIAATAKDAEVLRGLGRSLADRLGRGDRKGKADLWRQLNDHRPARPMVWINELPWHELAQADVTLICRCENTFLRGIEGELRRQLYQWDHFPADMILNDHIVCPKVWQSTGIGINVEEQTLRQHAAGGIVSHHFRPQIICPEDVEKIKMPEVSYNREATGHRYNLLCDIFDGILPVKLQGLKHIWFTPWDHLVQLVDMTGFMMDMIDRPEFIEALVSRYVDAKLHELDQIERLGLLAEGLDNCRVGSGGYAYTSDLPPRDYELSHVRCQDIWGCGNAQIFSEISPDMHWEFSLKHEMRWLERWGLTYYGCCEPLHNKIPILKRIPNLRKISLNPWCDVATARELGAEDYVLSIKPSPALFAADDWNPTRAREEIRTWLRATEGCTVELILKDVSTIRDDPRRLAEWERIAMEEVAA